MKIAIFVLADTDTPEGLGRVVNALEATRQFKEARNDVRIYFDGTGTKWISELNRKDHVAHDLFETVKDKIEGACMFCSNAFGATDSVKQCNTELVNEKDEHIDVQRLVTDGFLILNF